MARGKQIESDIANLQQTMRDTNRGMAEKSAQLDEQLQRADKKVEEVSTALQELNRAARMTDADFGVQMERLIKEVQELRGTLELTDFRLNKLEKGAEPAGSSTSRNAAPHKEEGANNGNPPKDKKALLAYGLKLTEENNLADARGVFRDLIKQWPKEVDIADAAHYALAESYSNDKKCSSAIPEYIKVIEGFPSGNYVDDAYYKIGLCSIEIGNLEDAQIFFNEIVANHKKSPLVKSAKIKLDDVTKRLAQEKNKNKPSSKDSKHK